MLLTRKILSLQQVLKFHRIQGVPAILRRITVREMSSPVTTVTLPGTDGRGVHYPVLDGIMLSPVYLQIGLEKRMSEIRNYPYEPDDILICTYPKSGTHWLCNLINVLRFHGDVNDAPSCNVPVIDFFLQQPSDPKGRLIHSHMRYKYLPEQHIKKKGKMILVVRNPKDVAVSYYQHLRRDRNLRFSQTWDGFVDNFLSGAVLYGSYFDYLNAWQEAFKNREEDLNIHIVYYEELQKDGLEELRRLQRYLGYSHTDDRLRQVLSRCNIKRLRSDVDEQRIRTMLKDSQGKGFLYRKGEIGDWQNHLTVAQNRAFDHVISEKLAGSMFNFSYLPTPKHKL